MFEDLDTTPDPRPLEDYLLSYEYQVQPFLTTKIDALRTAMVQAGLDYLREHPGISCRFNISADGIKPADSTATEIQSRMINAGLPLANTSGISILVVDGTVKTLAEIAGRHGFAVTRDEHAITITTPKLEGQMSGSGTTDFTAQNFKP